MLPVTDDLTWPLYLEAGKEFKRGDIVNVDITIYCFSAHCKNLNYAPSVCKERLGARRIGIKLGRYLFESSLITFRLRDLNQFPVKLNTTYIIAWEFCDQSHEN